MRTTILFTALLAGSLIYAQQATIFTPLYGLAGGTWQMKTKKGYICERWKKTGEAEMQGEGFRVNGKDTTIEERVRIIQKDEIYYVPTVTGQNGGKAVPFKLISWANKEYVFTNPAHDFPQRVVYHLVSPDSLHALVDGQYNGKYVKQDFYYRRIK